MFSYVGLATTTRDMETNHFGEVWCQAFMYTDSWAEGFFFFFFAYSNVQTPVGLARLAALFINAFLDDINRTGVVSLHPVSSFLFIQRSL